MLKTIAGHTSARGICRYLTRKNRALASDYINIDVPDPMHPDAAFDWARVMDSTRRAFGNDLPWRGKRVRTYKHYVVSPDPKDGIGLEALRELATTWAAEHFSEYEVAIVYHNDNARGIPHAHVVVNNTNIETGRRLQDPDPKALAASLQDIAERQGLSALRAPELAGVAARAQRRNPKRHPETYRSEYVRRVEKELTRVLLDSRHPRPRAHSPHRGEERGGVPKRALFHGRDRHGQLAQGAEARLDIRARRSSHQKDLRGAHGARLRARAP